MGFQRAAFEFAQDNDFDTSNAKAKGYERYVFGWTDPRGLRRPHTSCIGLFLSPL